MHCAAWALVVEDLAAVLVDDCWVEEEDRSLHHEPLESVEHVKVVAPSIVSRGRNSLYHLGTCSRRSVVDEVEDSYDDDCCGMMIWRRFIVLMTQWRMVLLR